MLAPDGTATAAVTLEALFDDIGTERLRYSARCAHLTGDWVQFEAHVSRSHDDTRWLAVDVAGACPDCSPTPVAALQLPDFELPEARDPSTPLTLRGRLSYGFQVDDTGTASFLRLEQAHVVEESVERPRP